MIKNNKIKLSIYLIFIFAIIGYLILNSIVGEDKFNNLKNFFFNYEQKKLIKKYLFPYKHISKLEHEIIELKKFKKENLELYAELYFKIINSDIKTKKKITKLSNNINLKKLKLESAFYYGIQNQYPGSGYIDFDNENMFILSSRGILIYKKDLNNNEINFKQITNNINNFIGIDQFRKSHKFSIKDLLIFNKIIYVSYTEEVKEDCWNTSVIYGNINYENIKFKKLFSPINCIHSKKNIDNEFDGIQAGGRMIQFDDSHILLTIGEYRSRYLAQDKESINGKIIKINTNTYNYKIISMGHRNPQGLYLDKENNFILETEHGPMGGDEINLIKINEKLGIEIPNYGWPIVSAGEHYGGQNKENKKKYKKYPLYKSHIKYGFVEPLKSFVPSIAISEIVKIGKNNYVFSSMKDKSIYFFNLDDKKKIINLKKIKIYERVRDLRFKNNILYMFLEDSASIGMIDLN